MKLDLKKRYINIDEYIKRSYYQPADSYHIEAFYAILTTSINPTKPLDRGVCLPISRGQAEELIVDTTNKRWRTCKNKTISDIIQYVALYGRFQPYTEYGLEQ